MGRASGGTEDGGESGRRTIEALNPDATGAAGDATTTGAVALPESLGATPAMAETVRCSYCDAVSEATRRFCRRCGRDLPRPAVATEVTVTPPHLPWWSRIRGAFGDDGFWQRMRRANYGARARFDDVASARDRAVRTAAALGVLGVVTSQLGPWGDDVRAQALGRVEGLLPSRYATLTITSAEGAAAQPAEYWADEQIHDRDTVTAWAGAWVPATEDGRCGRPDGQATVIVNLEAAADVDRVVVFAGLDEDSGFRPTQPQPRRMAVRLIGETATCEEFDMADTADQQAFEVSGTDVRAVRLEVVDVHNARIATPGPPNVALREVLVQSR